MSRSVGAGDAAPGRPGFPPAAARWVLLYLLIALTVSAYVPALRGGFVWDDDAYAANPVLAEPGALRTIWTLQPAKSWYYREFPLVYTTFWVERHIWGLDPAGYHRVNVALHTVNAILLWLLLAGLGMRGAWLAAAVFALHPVHVESVAWISERKNVLVGLFFLATLLCYRRHEETGRKAWYTAALGLFCAALLSKPVAAVLPLVLVLLHWLRGLRWDRGVLLRVLPFFALALAAGLFALQVESIVLGPENQRAEFDLSPLQRLLCAGRAFWFYPLKLLFPAGLAFSYERWPLEIGDPAAWLGVIALLVAAAGGWIFRHDLPKGALAGVGYYAISIAPLLGFVSLYTFRYTYIADHYQYLASIGLIAVAVGGAHRLILGGNDAKGRASAPSRRRLAVAIGAAVLVALWLATWLQAHDYQNEETLWRQTVRKNPASILARVELGVILLERGEIDQAITHLQEALWLNPDHYETRVNFGVALASRGKLGEAAEQYRQAIALKPRRAQPHKNLGVLLLRQGRPDDAASAFQTALSLNPADADAGYGLGAVRLSQGRLGEAVQALESALAVRPDHPQARDALGEALVALGRPEEAARHFREALRIRPDDARARRGLELLAPPNDAEVQPAGRVRLR